MFLIVFDYISSMYYFIFRVIFKRRITAWFVVLFNFSNFVFFSLHNSFLQRFLVKLFLVFTKMGNYLNNLVLISWNKTKIYIICFKYTILRIKIQFEIFLSDYHFGIKKTGLWIFWWIKYFQTIFTTLWIQNLAIQRWFFIKTFNATINKIVTSDQNIIFFLRQ